MRNLIWWIAMTSLSLPASAARLPETVVPRHYEIHLVPDLGTGELTGRESITVRITEPTATVVLNAVGLAISDAAVVTAGERRETMVSLDPARETATLTLPSPAPAGEARIELAFAGRLRDDLRGLYLTRTESRVYAATQFQATYARMAFPCFDEPAFKATFELSVVVDERDTAISNGRIAAEVPGPGPGKKTLRFSTSPVMSTYLVALAIGDFQCVEGGADGTPIRVCTVPGKQALGTYALRSAESFLPFFNGYYGIKYPFGKLDMVALPDYEWGGMENTASIFYRERALLVDEKASSVGARRGVAGIVAHEIAHQWFGDLVTLKWWDNVWLNEGFATSMTHKPLQAWDPAWDQSLEETQATVGVLGVDALESTRPIRQNGETPAEIKELFDGVAYQKGAALLRMVEAFMGPDVFRAGVRAYLAKYANGNATAEDLWSELTQASKRPVDRVMASFVDQAGAPLVTVATRCSEGRTQVTLTQQRFFADARRLAAGSPEQWTVPVTLRTPDGATRSVLLDQKSQTFEIAGCAPWLLANAGARGYYRSAYQPDALREISKVAATALTPAERIALLDDQWALVRAGRSDVAGLLALAEGLAGSPELAVQQSLLGLLGTLGDSLVDAAHKDRYHAWLSGLVRPAARELGWTVSASDSDDRKTLRALLLGTLGEAGDTETLAEAKRLAALLLTDPSAVDPSLAGLVLGLAARQGDAGLYDSYVAGMAGARTPEEYYRFLNALPAFRDEALVRRSLDLTLSGKIRSQDLPGFTAALIGNSASRAKAWPFLQANWPALQDKVVSFGGRGAITALAAFCDEASATEIERFFAANRAPGAERALKRSLESIRSCVELRKLQGESMRAWLAALKSS